MLNLLHASLDPDPLLSIVELGVADIITDVMLTMVVIGPGGMAETVTDEEINGVVLVAVISVLVAVVVVMVIGTGQNEGQSIEQRITVYVINKLVVMIQLLCA